jgi:hypothetical protein
VSRALAGVGVGIMALWLSACSTQPQRVGVDYPPVPAPRNSVAPPPAQRPPVPAIESFAAGNGHDARYERSALLTDTVYRNAEVLLQQVSRSGAMGINRGWESNARKGGEWYIEEQRFADTIIGAGVNRNRADLIDAGLRALEWGFAQQAPDGSFPCRDNFLSTSYFVAAAGHSIWLLETTGSNRGFETRLGAIREPLSRAARWLMSSSDLSSVTSQADTFVSRYFLTGYALAISGRVLGSQELSVAGAANVRKGFERQLPSGVFPEGGGFDASFQAEALVYLLRFSDHAASQSMRNAAAGPLSRGLQWLEGRVNPQGVVSTTGNSRAGAGKERDRTGQPRRISAVAVSRAFGLARYVLDGAEPYERLARLVALAKQPS